MPSTNKTTLGLNAWVGGDKPKRIDFVADNNLLNTLLTGHFDDVQKHISAQERTALFNKMVKGMYSGSGASVKTIALPFAASFVVVFTSSSPLTGYNKAGDYTLANAGVATQADSTSGCVLEGSTLKVYQSTAAPVSGGVMSNLNNDELTYSYVAWR